MLTSQELHQIQEIFQKEMLPINKDLKIINKDLGETRNDVKVLISYFNHDYVNLRKRIEVLEEHLGILTS